MLSNRLKIFVAVCESGGFTKAGEKLFISQSAISKQMKILEDEMGTKLIVFRRGQNKMYITRHGEILFKHCQRVILEDVRLKEELKHIENYIPPFEPYKVITKMCDNPSYIMGRKLNELITSIAKTRGERDRLYNALRDDATVRKKVFDSGQRRFYYYHQDDVKRYIEKMKI